MVKKLMARTPAAIWAIAGWFVAYCFFQEALLSYDGDLRPTLYAAIFGALAGMLRLIWLELGPRNRK